MILYVNGDSHSCGHDAGGPDFSYGKHVADAIGYQFVCDAEPAVCNDRIIRRTKEYLQNNRPDFLIIGWSTWEREEWVWEGTAYHVTASGHDQLPEQLHAKYKEYVISYASKAVQRQKEVENYHKIWQFHLELDQLQIPHVFFNTFSHFLYTDPTTKEEDWGPFYIDPYDRNMTFYFWLKNQGFELVDPKWHHYKADGQQAWAQFLLPKIKEQLTNIW